ncbi:MAG: sensor histidine kinase [Janthinobacterium lividum]
MRQRKIVLIVVGSCLLLLFLGLAALNAFRLTFLTPTSPGEIFLFTSISVVAFLLFVTALVLLMRNMLKLYADQRNRVLGARLRSRMLWGAVLLSLLPIACMYFFSYMLMNRAVDRWFSQPAAQLRDQSSGIATDLSRYVVANARSEAEELAAVIVDDNGKLLPTAEVERQMQRHEITLQGGFFLIFRNTTAIARHHAVASAPAVLSTLQPQEFPLDEDASVQNSPSPMHAQARGAIEDMTLQALRRTDHPIVSANGVDYIVSAESVKPDLQVVAAMPLPEGMTAHIAQLDRASQQYWTLFRLRHQIRRSYMLLMLMITSLALFVSSWLALHLSKQVTRPVEALGDAMAAIALGNYDQRVEASATEELGDLVKSFNTMAEDLESSRLLVEQSTVQVFEANVELEARRRELETMLQTIPNGVVMLDTERRIRVANRAFSEMLDPGGQRHFLGLLLDEVLPQDAREPLDRLLQRSHRMGTASAEMETQAQGGALNIAATVALLESNHGGLRLANGYVVVLENATELLRAQKQSAWKEVARRVAHEIKNPLTPISLSAEQIRRHIVRLGDTLQSAGVESPSVATIHRCSEVISGSVESMRSLVDQFSALAEFPNVKPRAADLNTVIDNTLALFAGRLKKIHVVQALQPNLPLALVDPEAIKRALSNLIDNAAEAMGNSLLREIHIETRRSDQSPGMLEVAVADTGPGVTDDMRERLFLPYFSTKGRGTGLGLTIAAKILADHGGSIRAEKNLPTGTRFILEVPLASVPVAAEAQDPDTEAQPA